jgi:hypothetical protein
MKMNESPAPRAALALVLVSLITSPACGAPASHSAPDTLGCPQFAPAAGWPIPNPPGLGLPHEARYDVIRPGIVRDRVTDLVWQGAGGEPGTLTRTDAASACSILSLAGATWRLPSVMELITLVDDTRFNPAIDPVAFPDTPGTYYWTSTPRAGAAGMGWAVYFGLGDAYYYDDTDTNAVRCVMTPPPANPCLFTVGDTVAVARTHLTWQRAVDPTPRTWDDAAAHCQALDLAGGGWRLPRLNELRSIVDFTHDAPAAEPLIFPDTPSENFWTASASAHTPGSAWYVYFGDGFAGYNVTSSTYRVRCVR